MNILALDFTTSTTTAVRFVVCKRHVVLPSSTHVIIVFSRIILVYYCKCCNLIGYS